jgi:FtsZ-binding cell division protein ZapB
MSFRSKMIATATAAILTTGLASGAYAQENQALAEMQTAVTDCQKAVDTITMVSLDVQKTQENSLQGNQVARDTLPAKEALLKTLVVLGNNVCSRPQKSGNTAPAAAAPTQ